MDEVRDKGHFLTIIRGWKTFWMNQKQNSEADYQNYFTRAHGVDANMTHHLADLMAKDYQALLEKNRILLECVRWINELDMNPENHHTDASQCAICKARQTLKDVGETNG